jgi:hypothetical protein
MKKNYSKYQIPDFLRDDSLEDRIDEIWNRIMQINKTGQRKFKRIILFRRMAVACSIVFIVGGSFWGYTKFQENNSNQTITTFIKAKRLHTEQSDDQIQLLSGKKLVKIDGIQAKVEYNLDGNILINKQVVNLDNQKKSPSKEASKYNELRVPYGKRAHLTLSDGTSIWVNTGTTIIYPVVFAEDRREIFIEGEIYAEIHQDKNRPFCIKTEKVNVKVLGTILNVTAYKEDGNTNVVLVSGSVDVKPKNGKSTVMQPLQMFTYSNEISTLTTVNVENHISWHKGMYVFRNEPIEAILLRLARYYNVTVELPSISPEVYCSGKLELREDFESILNGLTEIISMNYGIKDNEYKISFTK